MTISETWLVWGLLAFGAGVFLRLMAVAREAVVNAVREQELLAQQFREAESMAQAGGFMPVAQEV